MATPPSPDLFQWIRGDQSWGLAEKMQVYSALLKALLDAVRSYVHSNVYFAMESLGMPESI